jgi:hypothetical protein
MEPAYLAAIATPPTKLLAEQFLRRKDEALGLLAGLRMISTIF